MRPPRSRSSGTRSSTGRNAKDVPLPVLGSDPTFARARHLRVYAAVSPWDEDGEPVLGKTVLVAEGERHPFEAKIERIDRDGTVIVVIPAFAA